MEAAGGMPNAAGGGRGAKSVRGGVADLEVCPTHCADGSGQDQGNATSLDRMVPDP